MAKDYLTGFKTGKRGMKAGALTIKQYKASIRHKHIGGTGPPDRGVKWWVKFKEGKAWGSSYDSGWLSPIPLGKPPVKLGPPGKKA